MSTKKQPSRSKWELKMGFRKSGGTEYRSCATCLLYKNGCKGNTNPNDVCDWIEEAPIMPK